MQQGCCSSPQDPVVPRTAGSPVRFAPYRPAGACPPRRPMSPFHWASHRRVSTGDAATGPRAERDFTGRGRRGGFSMVEVVISLIVVSVLLTASLNTVGASVRGTKQVSNVSLGAFLAQEMMSEILTLPYADPDGPTVTLGKESGESSTKRQDMDDIDDFNGWSNATIQNRDGSVRPGMTGWSRSVTVNYVSTANLVTPSIVDTGLKRVVVRVTFKTKFVAELCALRSGPASLKLLRKLAPNNGPPPVPDPAPMEIP